MDKYSFAKTNLINLHTGTYQCVAKNIAGEAQAYAVLNWINKNYLPAPEIIKCYPFNRTSLLLEFAKGNEVVIIIVVFFFV